MYILPLEQWCHIIDSYSQCEGAYLSDSERLGEVGAASRKPKSEVGRRGEQPRARKIIISLYIYVYMYIYIYIYIHK